VAETYFRQVIPRVLGGGDVVAMARTGSGKTAAFLAPMACRLVEAAEHDMIAGGRRVSGLRGLILLPTRELALQTFLFFKRYAKFTTLSACLIAGGESIEAQFAALATNPEVGPHNLHYLYPTPYTLHPTPYTLHSTPYTLHPTPQALTLNPPRPGCRGNAW